MDPNATLQQMIDAWHTNDWAEMEDAARDLNHWIGNNGTLPKPTCAQLLSLVTIARNHAHIFADDKEA